MKKLLVLTSALLMLTASLASAANPIKLAWQDCRGSAGASIARSFDCLTNPPNTAPVGLVVTSFLGPANLTHYVDATSVVYARTSDGSNLPDWWKMRTAECRAGSYATDLAVNQGLTGCADPSGDDPNATPAQDYHSGPFAGPPAALASEAVVVSDNTRTFEGSITLGTHYYATVSDLRGAKSTGAGSCAGCLTPMCLEVTEIQIYQTAGSPGGDLIILRSNAAAVDKAEATVSWQGAVCGVTPVRNATWGSIKTLYR